MPRNRVAVAEPRNDDPRPYHIKYRPKDLNEVVGQKEVVKSLGSLLKSRALPHAYLFSGQYGSGKTTLARIITNRLKIEPANIIEVDAASNSGIDAMRELTSALRYNGFGTNPNKAIIIDEAHGLSKQAWDSLLKSVEEPPPHVYFFFCTTVEGKVPDTIVSRCVSYSLKSVKFDDLMDLLGDVCEQEGLQTSEDIAELIARSCNGSPRMALTMLAKVKDCEDVDEAAVLLESAEERKEVIDFCRALVKGELRSWSSAVAMLKAMGDMPAESIRIVVTAYLSSCLMGAKSDKDTLRLLDLLSCFSKPFAPSDKMAPLLLAVGNCVFP